VALIQRRRSPEQGSVDSFLLDQVPAAVVATDPHGNITRWNRQAEKMFGWSKEEAHGRPVLQILVPEDETERAAEILDRLRAGQSWEGELRLRRKDGVSVLCQVTNSPILSEDGTTIGMVGVSVDVSGRKHERSRLAARTAVTNILAGADSLLEVAPTMIEAICESLDWDIGAIWTVDEEAGLIRCLHAWHRPGFPTPEFVSSTRDAAFPKGTGLPGRVWAWGAANWIPDVVEDTNFPRAAVAKVEGVHGAFGFPIMLGGEVLGVLEFFSRNVREADEALLEVMGIIGSQIGQFMERKQAEDDLRKSRDQLETIFQGVSEGIAVLDPAGTIRYANEAAARMIGFRSVPELLVAAPDDVVGRFQIMDEDGLPVSLDELPGRLALQGREPIETTVRYRDVRTGEERWSIVRAAPVFDPFGRVQFAIAIFHDVTERRRAEEAQRFLSEASDVLSQSLDYEETLTNVARLAVESLADWCSVYMLQEDGSIAQLAIQHVDPSKVELAEEWAKRYPIDANLPYGVAGVIRTGRPELMSEIPDSLLEEASPDPELVTILKQLGLKSAMTVPLVAGGRILGGITFVSAESSRLYTPLDLAYAEQLADRAALAVNNAKLFKERDEIASVLQQSLVPPDLPEIPGLEVAQVYRAAGAAYEVGGDFYDAFATGDGGWAMVIGDVCGKGPAAAAITGVARHSVRTAAMKERRPSEILSILNDALIQEGPRHTFCTVAYVRLRPSDRGVRLTVCCGGHPLPLVLRVDGRVETAGLPGTLLGVFPDPELKDHAVELESGDALVLYTDGVTEELAPSGRSGRETLMDLVGTFRGMDAVTIARSIERAVLDARPRPPRDDIAILVAKVNQ
jgi:PAS domain S-box-containing protein